MTQGFDEWFESMGHMDGYQHHYQDAYDTGHEVGAQSRQSEIDELQKRINFLEVELKTSNDAIVSKSTYKVTWEKGNQND